MIQAHSNLSLKLLGIAIILIAFTIAPVHLAYSQTENFEFTIETDKSNYIIGEPVSVKFELKNISPDVVDTDLFPPYEQGNIEIFITQNGNDPTNFISEKMRDGMEDDLFIPPITLGSGESTTSTEFISFNLFTGNLAFPVPAEYQIEAMLIVGENSVLESNIVNIIVTGPEALEVDALSCLEANGLLMFLTPDVHLTPESLDPNLINKANECLANFPDSIYSDFVRSSLAAIAEVPIPECPPDTIGTYPECVTIGVGIPVGGELIPIDSTSLLLVGAQMNAAWMIPVIVSAIGIGIVIARKF